MIETAQEIGILNANAAFDQFRDFDSLDCAIASYWDNARDTLAECGLANDACHVAMERAFNERVATLRATI